MIESDFIIMTKLKTSEIVINATFMKISKKWMNLTRKQ